jgi:2-dehydropantoate 2-reductase
VRHLVFGAGAVGSFVGAQLALAGYPVTFLVRRETADRFRTRGLALIEGERETSLPSPHWSTDLSQIGPAERPDVIWLAVKAFDCASAAEHLRSAFSIPVPVICLLNGIGNETTLAAQIGQENVIAASLTTAVQRLEPGLIRIERRRGLALEDAHPKSRRLAEEAAQAGLAPRLYADGQSMKWSKLLTNLVGNATSAILGWTPRQVFDHPGLYRLEIEALRETVRAVRALGLRVVDLPGVSTALLSRLVFWPPLLTAPLLRRAVVSGRGDKLPSFNYDVGRGRSEVGWLNGAVATTSSEHGLRAPANATLTHTLTGLVNGVTDPSEYRGRPDVLLREAAGAGVPGVQRYNAAT